MVCTKPECVSVGPKLDDADKSPTVPIYFFLFFTRTKHTRACTEPGGVVPQSGRWGYPSRLPSGDKLFGVGCGLAEDHQTRANYSLKHTYVGLECLLIGCHAIRVLYTLTPNIHSCSSTARSKAK